MAPPREIPQGLPASRDSHDPSHTLHPIPPRSHANIRRTSGSNPVKTPPHNSPIHPILPIPNNAAQRGVGSRESLFEMSANLQTHKLHGVERACRVDRRRQNSMERRSRKISTRIRTTTCAYCPSFSNTSRVSRSRLFRRETPIATLGSGGRHHSHNSSRDRRTRLAPVIITLQIHGRFGASPSHASHSGFL